MPKETVSFVDLISPYYGTALKAELGKAMDYVNQRFPAYPNDTRRRPVPGNFGSLLFQNFTPEQIQREIPIERTASLGTTLQERENYNSKKDTITLKPAAGYLEDANAYGLQNENDVLQHEGSHATFMSPKLKSNEPTAFGPEYFRNTNERVAQLAVAQRENFRKTGKRFDETSLPGFLEEGKFDGFSPSSQNLFRLLQKLSKGSPEEQQDWLDTLKVLPGLVQNNTTAEALFG